MGNDRCHSQSPDRPYFSSSPCAPTLWLLNAHEKVHPKHLPRCRLAVVGAGSVELWWTVPLGLALGLNPVLCAAASALGATLSAAAMVLIGGPIRRWAAQRVGAGEAGRAGWARRVWDRYGVVGLGISAPRLTGAPLGAALGVALGVPSRRLLAWVSIGIVAWSALLTVAGALGWAALGSRI